MSVMVGPWLWEPTLGRPSGGEREARLLRSESARPQRTDQVELLRSCTENPQAGWRRCSPEHLRLGDDDLRKGLRERPRRSYRLKTRASYGSRSDQSTWVATCSKPDSCSARYRRRLGTS